MSGSTRYLKLPPVNTSQDADDLAAIIQTALDAINPVAYENWVEREWPGTPNEGQVRRDKNGNWVLQWPFDGPFTNPANMNGPEYYIPCPETLDPDDYVIVDTADYPEPEE